MQIPTRDVARYSLGMATRMAAVLLSAGTKCTRVALSYNELMSQQRSGGFFFFQAEDGIRDYKLTGVQTCALPICRWREHMHARSIERAKERAARRRIPGRAKTRTALAEVANDVPWEISGEPAPPGYASVAEPAPDRKSVV